MRLFFILFHRIPLDKIFEIWYLDINRNEYTPRQSTRDTRLSKAVVGRVSTDLGRFILVLC